MNTHRLWDDNDKAHKGQKTRAQLVDNSLMTQVERI